MKTISDAALVELYWRTTGDDWAIPDEVMVKFGRAVLRLAAASPTPTGPNEDDRCRDCHGVRRDHIGGAGSAPGCIGFLATPTGPEPK